MHNWSTDSGSHVQVSQENDVPESFETIVRKVVRDLFLEKNVVLSVNRIYERSTSLEVRHVPNMNLFLGTDIPTEESKLWLWSRSTLYRFMKKIGFVYGERISHYGNTEMRQDIIKMRDECLEWIDKYQNEVRGLPYRNKLGCLQSLV